MELVSHIVIVKLVGKADCRSIYSHFVMFHVLGAAISVASRVIASDASFTISSPY